MIYFYEIVSDAITASINSKLIYIADSIYSLQEENKSRVLSLLHCNFFT